MSAAVGASQVLTGSPHAVLRAPSTVGILAGLLVVLVTGTLVRAIVRERRWFNSLLETAPDAVVVTDNSGKIVLANGQAERMFAYPRRELVGRFLEEFLPGHLGEEGSKPVVPEHTSTPSQRESDGFELYGRRSDGTKFPVELSAGVLEDGETFVTTVARDIPGRKQAAQTLRQSEERYRLTVENMHDVVYMLDTSGDQPTPLLVDGRVRELAGCQPEEFLEQPGLWLELVDPDDRDAVLREMARILSTGTPIVREYRLRNRRTGDLRWVEDRSFPEVDSSGRVIRVFGIARDITDRREAEAVTREKNVAEQASKAKSEFLSRVSHELRTPLNAVLGFAQLLEMDELSSDHRDKVEQILDGGRHLLDLINEVLDITRIEAGRLSMWIEPTPLAGVVRESVELLQPLAVGRRIAIEIDREADWSRLVMADEQRLKQVLLNLLSNAIKYNRDGGSVKVSCRKVAEDRLRIDVSDSGLGIDEDLIDKAFAPFERLGADQRQVEGTGLGLTLSQNLVEAMGGTLTATSTLAVGSTFTVELLLPGPSIAVPELQTGEPAAGVPVTDQHRTLLYIEDNLSNVVLVEHILEHVPGTKLLTAMQGGLGLELAREHQPDLILLDLDLPDIEGGEVLRRLREDPRTRDIHTVILTADANLTQGKMLTDSGADAVLTKPIDVDELLRVLE